MPTLQKTISEKFLKDLIASKALDETQIDAMRKLLAQPGKPKPDDFIKVFTAHGGDIP